MGDKQAGPKISANWAIGEGPPTEHRGQQPARTSPQNNPQSPDGPSLPAGNARLRVTAFIPPVLTLKTWVRLLMMESDRNVILWRPGASPRPPAPGWSVRDTVAVLLGVQAARRFTVSSESGIWFSARALSMTDVCAVRAAQRGANE